MKIRAKTSFFIVATVLVFLASRLLYVGLFDIGLGIVAMIGCMEMCRMFNLKNKQNTLIISALYPVYFYIVFTICMLARASIVWYVLSQAILFVVLLIVAFLSTIKLGAKYSAKNMLNTMCIMLYPGILFCLLFVANNFETILNLDLKYLQLSYIILSLILMVSAITDTFAYIFGSLIRGPRLAPKISPNKSVSGALFGILGGICASLAIFGLCCAIKPFKDIIVYYNLSIWKFVIIGAICSIVGQVGDLFESWIKRRFEVKDSGNIFPGHGGMLDRVDSELFNCVAVLLFFIIVII